MAMEIEVEADEILSREKSIMKLFSRKRKIPKKESKKAKFGAEKKIKTVVVTAKKRNWVTLLVIPSLVMVSLFLGYFTHYYSNKYKEALKIPLLSEKNKDQAIVDVISKSMELPSGESPIVAAVNDVEKISHQSFFSDAQEDDQMVIYSEAKKAIVYRPSSGKVIDVVLFLENSDDEVAEAQPEAKKETAFNQVAVANVPTGNNAEKVLAETDVQEPKEEKKVRIAIYNGTKNKGVSAKLAEQLSSVNVNLDIVIKANAKGDYQKTTIIDLVGDKAELVANLAGVLGGDVSTSFPDGESMPEADVLIIGGGNN
jgi:hypothetical protein